MNIHPDLYHGENKTSNFFEGWYFKLVDKTGDHALALIPGIAFSHNKSDHHCFIQIINFIDHTYHYCRFEPAAFHSNQDYLEINIENNRFSYQDINIHLDADEQLMKGTLSLSSPLKWPDSKLNPGSMGFYNHFSFMECYSQVCAVDGTIMKGDLTINGKTISFSEGRYYIEKNWGKSFPSSWLWIQSNHFPGNRATVTCSLGIVPFPIINKFRGFIIGVTIDQNFYSFTTMNRSSLSLNILKRDIILTSTNQNLTLTLKTKSKPEDFLLCYGPKAGKMIPLVHETLKGEVEMTLFNTKLNKLIYHGTGKACGIEYGGNQDEVISAYLKP